MIQEIKDNYVLYKIDIQKIKSICKLYENIYQ